MAGGVSSWAALRRPDGLGDARLSITSEASYGYRGLGRQGGALRITDAGEAAVGDAVDTLPTGDELIDFYKRTRLNSSQGNILDRLVEVWPESMPRGELAEAVGLEAGAGTFGTYLSRMRGLHLIEGSSELRATDALMEGVKGGGHVRGA